MKVRIFNSDNEIDLRSLFEQRSAYSVWMKANPNVKLKQTYDLDYFDFENEEDAVAFKLRFALYD